MASSSWEEPIHRLLEIPFSQGGGLFLVGAAASSALPIAPAGAATQAGAGAAILVASGISTSQAIAFAVAAQAILIAVAAVVLLFAAAWGTAQRFRPARAAA